MKTRIYNYATDYSSPSSNKQLLQDFATTGGMNFITTEDIDSEGSKAKKITAELNDKHPAANNDTANKPKVLFIMHLLITVFILTQKHQ